MDLFAQLTKLRKNFRAKGGSSGNSSGLKERSYITYCYLTKNSISKPPFNLAAFAELILYGCAFRYISQVGHGECWFFQPRSARRVPQPHREFLSETVFEPVARRSAPGELVERPVGRGYEGSFRALRGEWFW
jgi:hypothetical protein